MAESITTKLAFDGNVFSHQIGTEVCSVDLDAAFPGYSEFADNVKSALQFAIKTASRNATAGKLQSAEAVKEAIEAVKTRHATWLNHGWAARREASGEPRSSMLAQALAELSNGEFTAEEMAENIDKMVEAACDEAGLDQNSEEKEDKAKIRTIRSAINKKFRSMPEVAEKIKDLEFAKLAAQREEAKKAADAAREAGTTSVSELFKR